MTNLYDVARRECAEAMFEFPEDGQLPKSAVLELMVQAFARGHSAAREEPSEAEKLLEVVAPLAYSHWKAGRAMPTERCPDCVDGAYAGTDRICRTCAGGGWIKAVTP